MSKNLRIALAVAAFFALEAVLVGFVDRPVAEFLRGVDRDYPGIIDIFRVYTDFGKSGWYLWPAGAYMIACAALLRLPGHTEERQRRLAERGRKALFFFLSIALSGIATDCLKPMIGRARPVELAREGLYGFRPFSFDAAWNSMPSGHATTAIALTLVLTALFPRYRFAWLAIGLLLAISRVAVNAHFMADIVAGGAVAYLTVYAVQQALGHHGMFHVIGRIFPIDRKNTTL